MSSLSIRSNIARNKEYYICPLQMITKGRRDELREEIEKAILGEVTLEKIYKGKGEEKKEIGYGHEYEKEEEIKEGKKKFAWKERRQVVYSKAYFKGEKEKLDSKIEKGIKEIKKLKAKQFPSSKEKESLQEMEEKIKKIKAKYSLEKLLEVTFKKEVIEKEFNRTEKRNGKIREGKYTLKKIKILPEKVEINKEELKNLYDRLGWRLYVTNVPRSRMSLQDAYNHYRGSQYIVEHSFHVLKDKPIGLKPIFVWKDDQIKGLMRLLILCLKVSSVISSKLRVSLQNNETCLQDVYAGQPKKKTSSPMTKTILNLFYRQNITLTSVSINDEIHWEVSKMSKTCREILSHLGLNNIYENILRVLKKENKETGLFYNNAIT